MSNARIDTNLSETNEPSELNEALAKLEEEAKRLSKLIGQAKRSGEDASELIAAKKSLHQDKIEPLKKQIAETVSKKASAQTIAQKQIEQLKPPAPYKNPTHLISSDSLALSLVDLTDKGRDGGHESNNDSSATLKQRWDTYIAAHPSGNIYYEWRFLEAISRIFGHKIKLLTATEKQSGQIIGVLPIVEQKSRLFGHLWTSIAFVNYGGPLCNNEKVEASIFEFIQQVAKRENINRLEVRGLYERPIPDSWNCSQDKASMWLPLPSDNNSDTLLSSFKAKLRSQIRKGYTESVNVKVGGLELIDDYYTVFARNMRDLGTPVYSKRLFSELLNTLANQAWLVLIYHQGKPASAAFLIKTGDRMEIPWASTIRDYNRFGLNMVLYWEVLKLSCEQKCVVFDFGRSSINATTYKFKKQWGAQPIQHYWYGYEPGEDSSSGQLQGTSKASTENPKFKILIACWKRLPIWLSKLIGPSIVKFIP
ncbi:hypothetical protein A3765_15060 [Oleiphilus sp. HI0130]|nr:hypothetical protein A3765_15060 [Oleiphilus sp. HI0130]